MRILTTITPETWPNLEHIIARELGIPTGTIPDGFTIEYFGPTSPIVITWTGRTTTTPDVFTTWTQQAAREHQE